MSRGDRTGSVGKREEEDFGKELRKWKKNRKVEKGAVGEERDLGKETRNWESKIN